MTDLLNKFSTLYDLAKTFNNSKLLMEISDLKMDISNITDENRLLKDKIREFETLFSLDLTLNKVNGLYYAKNDTIPYCPQCYVVNKLPIRLKDDPHYGPFKCTNCKEFFKQ
jgi:hypothetical protein